MKHEITKEVSHGFLKKYKNSAKIGLRYDHREYLKKPPPRRLVRCNK